ncbi:caspase family protein [Nocardia gipuzkoensis]
MIRAGVFIGVDRTGVLGELFDAAAGARRMHAWALAQGMQNGVTAKLITDAGDRKVTPEDIKNAILGILDGPGVDQLIVYFAGHGVNINRNEQWLLSDAPRDTSAAVDVTGSVELARFSKIPHVVVISDACRVAPSGIQAGSVRGVDIFPNEGAVERSNPVDQFFACSRGSVAAELSDPNTPALNYTAVYTEALLDALNGSGPAWLTPSLASDGTRYLRVWSLKHFLEEEVPLRVQQQYSQRRVNQTPDAIITSENAWLARFEGAPVVVSPESPGPKSPGPEFPIPIERMLRERKLPMTLGDVVADLTRAVAHQPNSYGWDNAVKRSLQSPAVGTAFASTLDAVRPSFGPTSVDTACGIKVRGALVRNVFHPKIALHTRGDFIRVEGLQHGTASVLLQFENGSGTVVPAIPEFIAALTIEGGALVDVAYEPSTASWRWNSYSDRIEELRSLRAVAAAASQQGRYQLDSRDADVVARSMQLGKGIDPALALYAAYAFYDLQEVDRIREMSRYLHRDLGARLFDIELLGRNLMDQSADPEWDIFPFVPMFAQGWALLRAHRFRLHPALDGLADYLEDSVWSLYRPDGVSKLRRALASRELK